MKNDMHGWANPERILAHLREQAQKEPGSVFFATYGVWRIGYSEAPEVGCILSASLRVHGSVRQDWEVLGYICRQAGVPADHKIPQSIVDNPGGTHYWTWGGRSGTGNLEEAVKQARAVVAAGLVTKPGKA